MDDLKLKAVLVDLYARTITPDVAHEKIERLVKDHDDDNALDRAEYDG